MKDIFVRGKNARPITLAALPECDVAALREGILQRVENGGRLVALFGDACEDRVIMMYAVIADDSEGQLAVGRAKLESASYDALTPECAQAHWFEREMAEQFGLKPDGHPWLKPIRFQRPLGSDRESAELPQIGVTDFYRVRGEEVHEVAVGPVHAGVIEPGHFRFQCHGENVFHLEISLGYQHRGIERAMIGGPHKLTVHQMETIAGDTTVGHAIAYCQAVEALSAVAPPSRALALRGIALELERLANHVGDLGALSGDVGYLPTASYCGRIRGDFLNMTAALCGSRFGRGLIRPGGVAFDCGEAERAQLVEKLAVAERDAKNAVELLWAMSSVVARFENTGTVARAVCEEIGLVGPAARACGIERDVRHDHPAGIYQYAQVPVMTGHHGDVNSRALVRWLEMQQSIEFVRDRFANLPASPLMASPGKIAASAMTVSMVEWWRGELCHVAITDDRGHFRRYKIVDPSFHNWFGLAVALRGQQISDFPLCNKSFNLSYCGHDL